MIGMERQKPNEGGGAVTIFKHGQAPTLVQKAMEKDSIPKDKEKTVIARDENPIGAEDLSSNLGSDHARKGVARNDSIFVGVDKIIRIVPSIEGPVSHYIHERLS